MVFLSSPRKDWSELSFNTGKGHRTFPRFCWKSESSPPFLLALSQAAVTGRFVSLLKKPTGNPSSEGIEQSFTRHLLHYSPTFRQVYLLRVWLVLPWAVAMKLWEATIPPCSWGRAGVGRKTWEHRACLMSCTCLSSSPLNPQHLAGSPHGWAGHSHSNRCFAPPHLPPSSWEPPASGPSWTGGPVYTLHSS